MPTPPAAPSTSSVSPALQLRAIDERVVRRAVGQDERRRVVECEARRQRHDERGVDDRVRGEAAGAAERSDRIADLQVRDAFAHARRSMPAYSDPGTNGRAGLCWYLFWTISRSGKFRLAARIAIRTSPGWARASAAPSTAALRRRSGFRKARRAWWNLSLLSRAPAIRAVKMIRSTRRSSLRVDAPAYNLQRCAS